jgi:hypothetical protein
MARRSERKGIWHRPAIFRGKKAGRREKSGAEKSAEKSGMALNFGSTVKIQSRPVYAIRLCDPGSTKRVGFAVADGSLAVTCVHRLTAIRT